MKNCIVLSGQYRTFDQTWENIKTYIDANEMDVYCHLWSTDEREIQNVRERLNPTKLLVEDFSQYENAFLDIEKRVHAANPKPKTIDSISKNASMNYGRFIAYNLIEEEYDNLSYCRYDLGFNPPFKFTEVGFIVTPQEESYNLISDIFAVMPFKWASSYFLYNNYERLHSTQFEPEFEDWLRNVKRYPESDIITHKETRYCPHMILLRNLFLTGAPFDIVNIPVYLQR